MEQSLSKYVVNIKYRIDPASMRLVDRQMKQLEAKLRAFGKRISSTVAMDVSNFRVDQRKLNFALGNALDMASRRLIFEVTNFRIDQASLNAQMRNAMRRASNQAGGTVDPDVRGNGGISRSRALAAGGMGGIAARAVGPAIALGLGGYGLASLNRRNQEVVSAQLQSQAVVMQAGGTVQDGNDSFNWLREQGNRVGFNYLEASGDYNKLISGLTGAGMSVGQGQGVFKGFSELARVNKLDKTTQNRLFRALSQVAGKDKLMSEELTGQIAEALPGGVALFAEAYQRQTGGNLTGSAATTELLNAMKAGKVRGNILLDAGNIAGERAAPSLGAASTASQAEQGRFQNAVTDQAVIASTSGVEEGFARIFRTLATGLNESNSMTRMLANAFNEATRPLERILLFPQSFARALEGRDSLVADWLGLEATEQLREDWSQIKVIFDQISGMQTPTWMPSLEATTKEIAAMMNAIAEFSIWRQRTSDTAQQIISDEYNAGGGTWQANVKGVAKANWHTIKSLFGGDSDPSAQYMAQRLADNGGDISPFMGESGFDSGKYWDHMKSQAREQAVSTFGESGYNINQPVRPNQENTFNMEFKFENGDPEVIRPFVESTLADAIERSLVEWNIKE